MKRKIGELRNVPIVEGDKNLVRGGVEIHINDLQNKDSSSGGSSKYAPRYFSIDWDKCSDGWKYILSDYYLIDGSSYHRTIAFNATVKVYINEEYMIGASAGINSTTEDIVAFSYIPVSMPNYIQEAVGLSYQMPFNIKDLIEFINIVIKDVLNLDIQPISMEGITEITEEEYYKID